MDRSSIFVFVEKYAVNIERNTAIQTIMAVSKINFDSMMGDLMSFFVTRRIEIVRVKVM